MRTPSVLGLLAGLASAGLSIALNLQRGDVRFVSIAPDGLSLIVIAGFIATAAFMAAWRNPNMARRDAWHAAFVAAGAFAVTMAGFTRWYLPDGGPALGSVMALVGMVLTSLGGAIAGREGQHSRHVSA